MWSSASCGKSLSRNTLPKRERAPGARAQCPQHLPQQPPPASRPPPARPALRRRGDSPTVCGPAAAPAPPPLPRRPEPFADQARRAAPGGPAPASGPSPRSAAGTWAWSSACCAASGAARSAAARSCIYFHGPSALIRLQSLHTGERPHRCPAGSKSDQRQERLLGPRRLRTREPPCSRAHGARRSIRKHHPRQHPRLLAAPPLRLLRPQLPLQAADQGPPARRPRRRPQGDSRPLGTATGAWSPGALLIRQDASAGQGVSTEGLEANQRPIRGKEWKRGFVNPAPGKARSPSTPAAPPLVWRLARV